MGRYLIAMHELMKAIKGTHLFLFNLLRARLYFLSLHLDSEVINEMKRLEDHKASLVCLVHNSSNSSPVLVPVSLQITRTTMLTCPTPKWTQTSGARRPERRSVSPWRSSQTFWRSIMGINSSFQTGIWSPQEVSSLSRGDVKLSNVLSLGVARIVGAVVTCIACGFLLCICVVA